MDSIFYQKYRTGDLMAHATNDLNAIQNVAGAGILTFADSVITGGTTIIAMVLFVDWRLTLIALLPLPLLAVTSRVLGSKLHDAFRDSQVLFQRLMIKHNFIMEGTIFRSVGLFHCLYWDASLANVCDWALI